MVYYTQRQRRLAWRLAQVKATTKYIKNHMRTFVCRCNNETDADVIRYLNAGT